MNSWQAMVLGMVEGLTEFLPVSSTGHIIFFQRLLGIESTDASFAWAISIQLGAILAILVIYGARFRQMAAGLSRRDPEGRRLLVNLLAAFVPAAVIGLAGEELIADRLSGMYVISVAWAFWGIVILVLYLRRGAPDPTRGAPLETLTWRQAIVIGAFQCLALIPGTSRSLVCILGAAAVGLSVPSAVEFSFLLGVITLGAATAYQMVFKWSELSQSFGLQTILIGLFTSFMFALLSVKWMVSYLSRHRMTLFGWYRIGIAAVALALLATGMIKA